MSFVRPPFPVSRGSWLVRWQETSPQASSITDRRRWASRCRIPQACYPGGIMKALLLAALATVSASPVLDKPPVIKEWPVPWGDTRPRDPYLDPTTNRIWFCGQAGNYVAYFVPKTGELKRYELPPGSGPHNLLVDKSARVGYSGNLAGYIAQPGPETRPPRMEIASDDQIVYGGYAGGFLGRYDPGTGKVDGWQMPGGADARPYARVRDDEDRVWVVETSRPNRFVSFDAKTLQFSAETEVPSGGGVVRHMFYDPATKAIWFGTDNNTIGQAILPPRTPPAQTP